MRPLKVGGFLSALRSRGAGQSRIDQAGLHLAPQPCSQVACAALVDPPAVQAWRPHRRIVGVEELVDPLSLRGVLQLDCELGSVQGWSYGFARLNVSSAIPGEPFALSQSLQRFQHIGVGGAKSIAQGIGVGGAGVQLDAHTVERAQQCAELLDDLRSPLVTVAA